ncbi:DsbC family protein [Methylophaga lonarensis]|uniref:DsbC family protein n=1 Tax=Methylophaga lonarensis TaxID=999151 RepID=UPI003D293B8F
MFKLFMAAVLVSVSVASVYASDAEKIEARLLQIIPDLKIDGLQQLGDSGLYEGVINGQIIYVTRDGRYLMEGKVIDLESRTDVTELRRAEVRRDTLAAVDEASMISFLPEKQADYTLTVFTDIDCGYCRILHGQMDQYHAQGIAIRYMAYPRGGVGSDAYQKLVNVWCAKDQHQAMTDAKAELELPELQCTNAVATHFAIGNQLGVGGTPAMFLENGRMLPGYVPPQRLRAVLDEMSKAGQI